MLLGKDLVLYPRTIDKVKRVHGYRLTFSNIPVYSKSFYRRVRREKAKYEITLRPLR